MRISMLGMLSLAAVLIALFGPWRHPLFVLPMVTFFGMALWGVMLIGFFSLGERLFPRSPR